MLNSFLQQSLAEIDLASDFEDAMKRTRFLGELLWKNSVGQYELIKLEQSLVKRYAHLFEKPENTRIKGEYLHILTKAYDSGGHTRIVERLIHSNALRDAGVLITHSSEKNTLKKLSQAKNNCILLEKIPETTSKIKRLVNEFAQYRKLILHIHPHDIDTVFAAALVKQYFGTTVLFYNHADHVFSFGFSVADRVLEISYFGWALRQKRHSEHMSVFAGIPITLPEPDLSIKPVDEIATHAPYIASAGTGYKYKPSKGYSFPALVTNLAKKTQIQITLIGPKLWSNWWWWKAAAQLGKQLSFPGKIPHAAYLAFLKNAVAYVDSFPLTGGTAFPEIMNLGVPCFGILTGAHGYTPADQVKVANVAFLEKELLQFLNHKVLDETRIAHIRQQLHDAHDLSMVAQRIADTFDKPVSEQTPCWINPATIDIHYFEKIWRDDAMFAIPVHARPSLKLFLLFLKLWKSRHQYMQLATS